MNERRFYEGQAGGAKRSAPAALRNREPIADVLADWLPDTGLVLEIASGSGEHAVHFARRFPALDWQPTDLEPGALESIAAWREESRLPNVRPPLRLNAAEPEDWPVGHAEALLSINMVHISPWASAIGLVMGAARILPDHGQLILYGPWFIESIESAPSNLAFDADLRSRDPEWGIRRVEDFAEVSAAHGFALEGLRQMPANNLMLRYGRASAR